MARPRAILPYVIGFVLAAPIFFHVGPQGITLGQSVISSLRAPGIDLPLSAFAIFPILGWLLMRGHQSIRVDTADLLVVAYLCMNFLSYFLGNMFSCCLDDKTFFLSTSFLFQSVLPLLAYLVARLLPGGQTDADICTSQLIFLERILISAALTLAVSIFLIVLQTQIIGDSEFKFGPFADHIGPFTITKIKRYYPTLLSVAAIILVSYGFDVGLSAAKRWFRVLAGVFVMACVMVIWSRAALLTLGGGVIFLMLLSTFRGFRSVSLPALTLSCLVAVAFILVIPVLPSLGLTSVTRLIDNMGGEGLLIAGDLNRSRALVEALEVGLLRPLGEMYQPVLSHSLGGLNYDFTRLRLAEHGYLDLAVRAGPIAMFAALALVGRILWLGLTTVNDLGPAPEFPHRFSRRGLTGLSAALLSILVVSNQLQHNFTEPYAAVFVWFFLGLLLTVSQLYREQHGDRAMVGGDPGHADRAGRPRPPAVDERRRRPGHQAGGGS